MTEKFINAGNAAQLSTLNKREDAINLEEIEKLIIEACQRGIFSVICPQELLKYPITIPYLKELGYTVGEEFEQLNSRYREISWRGGK